METSAKHEHQDIFDVLDEMHSSIKKNEQLLKALTKEVASLRNEVKQLKTIHTVENETFLIPCLPFDSLEDLQKFDKKLLIDDEMRVQLFHVIKRIGGNNMQTFLRTALRTIISDELAINLTWRGTNDKPSIQEFFIFSLIKDVCHSLFQNATDLNMNKTCQQHFLHAKDRVNKRQSKTARSVVVETGTNCLPFLPFDSLEDLNEFDERLLEDENVRAQLNDILSKISARDVYSFLRRALKTIICDELAINLTWRGTNDKPSIQKFNIFDIIKGLVAHNSITRCNK